MKCFILGLPLLLAGCATYIQPEIVHQSHATQHQPFTDSPTRYGSNQAAVVLGWDLPHNVNVELAEGISLDRHYTQSNQYGEIEGPREQFTGRIGYRFNLK
jgi:hypothetical protein